MDRDPDRPARVLEPALHRLLDPERAVGGELEPSPPVELLDRPDQAQHALLDQVAEREPLALVAAGDRDHEPQVGVDHPLLRREVASLHALRELDLLRRRQQRVAPRLLEEELERVERGIGLWLRLALGLLGRPQLVRGMGVPASALAPRGGAGLGLVAGLPSLALIGVIARRA
jgi:hypothetical protein